MSYLGNILSHMALEELVKFLPRVSIEIPQPAGLGADFFEKGSKWYENDQIGLKIYFREELLTGDYKQFREEFMVPAMRYLASLVPEGREISDRAQELPQGIDVASCQSFRGIAIRVVVDRVRRPENCPYQGSIAEAFYDLKEEKVYYNSVVVVPIMRFDITLK